MIIKVCSTSVRGFPEIAPVHMGGLRASASSQGLLFCVLQDFAAYCRFVGFKK